MHSIIIDGPNINDNFQSFTNSYLERLVVFDLETTGLDLENDRTVQVAMIPTDSGEVDTESKYSVIDIVNPGIPVPEEASNIHGFTDEHVKRHGKDPGDTFRRVKSHLEYITSRMNYGQHAPGPTRTSSGSYNLPTPLVIFNATFDWPILNYEFDRYGIERPDLGDFRIIDPFVIDRKVDKYRRGSRKLVDMASHYGVDIQKAHDAEHDAVASARIVRKICDKFPSIANMYISNLQIWQEIWADEWSINYASYIQRNGGDASNICLGWPWPDPDMSAINPGPYKERILASHGVSLEDLETRLIHKTLRLNALETEQSPETGI